MRYELSHDIVARQVFEKASADAQTRRKIEKYIADRHAMYRERGALLTQDDLEYVRPHLDAIEPDADERAFIDASERAIRRRRNRVRLTVAGVMAVLLAATAYSLRAREEAQLQAQRATARQLIASANNALDDGTLDVAGLLVRDAALASDSAAARSALLTWHLKTAGIRGYLRAHSEPVSTVAFSPDGAMLATGSWDNRIAIYTLASGLAHEFVLSAHTDDVTGVAFSPDGGTLASSSNDSTVILWNVRSPADSQKPRLTLRGHNAEVIAVAFGPNGRVVASGTASGEVIVWNVADGQEIARWKAHENGANSVAFSPDGVSVASSGGDGIVKLRSINGRSEEAAGVGSREVWNAVVDDGSVNAILFSRNGRTIAAASGSGMIFLLDVRSGDQIGLFRSQPRSVASAVSLSPDERTLAVGSWDGSVVQWDMEQPSPPPQGFYAPNAEFGVKRRPTLTGHTSPVLGVAFSPDGQLIASASEDGSVILWDVSERPLLHSSLAGHQGELADVAFSPDSRLLASVAGDGTVRLWSSPFLEQVPRVLPDHSGRTSVTFSPVGQLLGTAGSTGIGLCDLTTPSSPCELLTSEAVADIAFGPDGKLLASAGPDSQITIWDLEKRSRTILRGHQEFVSEVIFSPDGRWLASSGVASDKAILWSLSSQEAEPLLGTDSPISSLAFSPDSRTLAAGSFDGLLLQWDLDDFRWRVLPRPHGGKSIRGVVFSPDGQSIATSSSEGTVMVWDVARNQPRGQALRGHPTAQSQATSRVAFSPDGDWLAAANSDGTVAVWNFSRDRLLQRVCSVVGRNLSLTEWQLYRGTQRAYTETCTTWDEPAVAGAAR